MPEGDTLHLAARRLRALAGARVEAESPHPRARATGAAEQVDGRILESVEAVGKHLVLRFEGRIILRSHLRLSGSWRVQPRGAPVAGLPWLVLRSDAQQAILRNGPVLELDARPLARLGPDILAPEADLARLRANLRAVHPSTAVGEAVLDQRLVSGIGNRWKAEALWQAGLSPWLALGEATDGELDAMLAAAAALMRRALDSGRGAPNAYGRAGRPCPRCGVAIRARGQGDDNRAAFWCPGCQRGEGHASA
jgi:endonuclease-8